jgi:ketosteroid isomerase-like protein
MTSEDGVRAASESCYAALNRMLNGDAGSLADIWSHSPNVTTMHPIGGRQVGWEEVRDAWEQVARFATEGHIDLADRFVQVAGDAAYELGVERGQFVLAGRPVTANFRVTNIYRRDAGSWKIVHHHSDFAPDMVKVLEALSH